MSRLTAAIVTILALALAGCGVRGGLEPAPGAPQQQNGPYHLDPLI